MSSTLETSHAKSTAVLADTLNMFQPAPTMATFTSSDTQKVYPVSALQPNSTITFELKNLSPNHFLTLADAYFCVSAKIASNNGVDAVADIAITDGLASTFVKHITVHVNDKIVSNYDSFFLRSSIDNFFRTPKIEFESFVTQTQLYDGNSTALLSYNTDPYKKREEAKGSMFDFVIPLNCDLGSTEKYILPGFD